MTPPMPPLTRPAVPEDAEGMAAVLMELVAAGRRRKPADAGFVLAHYIAHPDRIECSVALGPEGTILGFQSLKLAVAGNVYGVTPGWGIIGTHVSPAAARRGVGKALFAATRAAAERAGLTDIDATIGAGNATAQSYYEAMGFRDYGDEPGAARKRYRVGP